MGSKNMGPREIEAAQKILDSRFTAREGTILQNLLYQRKDAILAANRTDPSRPSETAMAVAELESIASKVREITR